MSGEFQSWGGRVKRGGDEGGRPEGKQREQTEEREKREKVRVSLGRWVGHPVLQERRRREDDRDPEEWR